VVLGYAFEMARPLRIDLEDGWYHVVNRGIERRRIFQGVADFARFIEVLEELPTRFAVLVHAYALMPNHYHLLLQTPKANLSQAMQWLNVSYSVWFNRKHRRVGPLFQGRFKGILLAAEGPPLEVSRYIHLNPVRTRRFDLSKDQTSLPEQTPAALIRERLQFLRTYRWSSFGSYGGLTTPLPWLTTQTLLGFMGGKTEAQRRKAYQGYVEEPVRAGIEDTILDRALTPLVVGGKEFVSEMLAMAKGEKATHRAAQRQNRDLTWSQIQKAVAAAKQQPWEDFCNRRGDLGRELALLVARRYGRYTLAELGALVGVTYAAVAQAVAKAENRVSKDKETGKLFLAIQEKLQLKKR
jgi:putative transposase